MQTLTVALSGATGYIATHVAISLHDAGHKVVGFDNFDNSAREVLNRYKTITGTDMAFAQLDVRDTQEVAAFLKEHNVDAVIHLAGLKAVGESVENPQRYYDVNVAGSLSLIEAMKQAKVSSLVFSSSATVYSPEQESPLGENAALGPINPYGRSKLMVEQIITDVCNRPAASAAAGVAAGAGASAGGAGENVSTPLNAINLRYFNPVGAHPSGLVGEDPVGTPNNLMPFIMQVAVGRREQLTVFGDDYPTEDGSAIRDYIHVCDLAEGHVAAVETLAKGDIRGCEVINLGTGIGSSVFQVHRAAEEAVGEKIASVVGPRRDGDAAVSFANADYAKDKLGWVAKRNLAQACNDHWVWQSKNPNGYTES